MASAAADTDSAAIPASQPATTPRRGRPPASNTLQHHPPGHADYPLHDWSVTVAVRGGDVPTSWLHRMKAYAQAKAECGCFATELGGRLKRLHVQGMLRIRSVRSEAYKDVLKKDIVAFIPIQRGSGGTVAVSPFGETQAWLPMLGYIQKDQSLGHYELAVHNVSDSDLRQVSTPVPVHRGTGGHT